MKHIKLSSLGVIYSLTTVLLLVAIGVFYFHEKLNIYEIIGIVAAIVSVILLSRFA
jgi:drug/metabolite transporter (DMT)-like permease